MSDHPVCGAKEGFAGFSLMPQPPLLKEEGNTRDQTSTPMKFIEHPSRNNPAAPATRTMILQDPGSIMSFEYGHSMCVCYLLVNGCGLEFRRRLP